MLSRCCRRASFSCFMKHFTPKSNEKHPISCEIRCFPGRGRKTRTLDTRFWSESISPQFLWYQWFADFLLSRFRASFSPRFGSSKIHLQSFRTTKMCGDDAPKLMLWQNDAFLMLCGNFPTLYMFGDYLMLSKILPSQSSDAMMLWCSERGELRLIQLCCSIP